MRVVSGVEGGNSTAARVASGGSVAISDVVAEGGAVACSGVTALARVVSGIRCPGSPVGDGDPRAAVHGPPLRVLSHHRSSGSGIPGSGRTFATIVFMSCADRSSRKISCTCLNSVRGLHQHSYELLKCFTLLFGELCHRLRPSSKAKRSLAQLRVLGLCKTRKLHESAG